MCKQRMNASCRRCIYPEEDTTHVLQCQGEGIYELRKVTLLDLRVWMKSVHTQPDIEYFIIHVITSWLYNDNVPFMMDDTIDPVMLHACRYQVLLGWETLLHGFISKRLIICQHDHYSEMSSRKLDTRCGL